MTAIMQCGCAPAGKIKVAGVFVPGCITHECTDVAVEPDLSGRMAKCYCGMEEPSRTTLPFFQHVDGDHDVYFCGCGGWS